MAGPITQAPMAPLSGQASPSMAPAQPAPLAPQQPIQTLPFDGVDWETIDALPPADRAAVVNGLLGNEQEAAPPLAPEQKKVDPDAPKKKRGPFELRERSQDELDQMVARQAGLLDKGGTKHLAKSFKAGLDQKQRQIQNRQNERKIQIQEDAAAAKIAAAQAEGLKGAKQWDSVTIDGKGRAWGIDRLNPGKGMQLMPMVRTDPNEKKEGDSNYIQWKTLTTTDEDGNQYTTLIDPGSGEKISAPKGMTEAQAKMWGNLRIARAGLQTMKDIFFDEEGEPNYFNIGSRHLPWTPGQQGQQAVTNLVEIMLRSRTGAAAPEAEQEQYRQMFTPKLTDSPEAARAKFERMAMFFDALEQGLSAGLSRNEMMELRPPGWTEQEEENLQSALNGDFLTYDPVTGKFSDEE